MTPAMWVIVGVLAVPVVLLLATSEIGAQRCRASRRPRRTQRRLKTRGVCSGIGVLASRMVPRWLRTVPRRGGP
jgi:hypothetical protein